MNLWSWYKSHEKVQWALILIPLWMQPIHMWAMAEQVAHTNELIDLQELTYHLTNWNIWLDIFWLAIDYAEWIAIVVATEKFIRWALARRAKK